VIVVPFSLSRCLPLLAAILARKRPSLKAVVSPPLVKVELWGPVVGAYLLVSSPCTIIEVGLGSKVSDVFVPMPPTKPLGNKVFPPPFLASRKAFSEEKKSFPGC